MSWSKNKLNGILIALGTVTLVAYPFAVFFGIQYLDVRYLGVVLAALFLVRFLAVFLKKSALLKKPPTANTTSEQAPKSSTSPLPKSMVYLPLAGAALALLASAANHTQILQFYPILMSLLMLFIFASTLIYPPSLIERFARLQLRLRGKEDFLPPEAIQYTKKVTMVWCVFFVFNASIASYSCFWGSLEFWTLYNGLISYLLMGALFAGEFLVRQWVMKKHEQQTQEELNSPKKSSMEQASQ